MSAKVTREFSILNVLTGFTGQILTSEMVLEIYNKIKEEMNHGSTSWAFKSGGNHDGSKG